MKLRFLEFLADFYYNIKLMCKEKCPFPNNVDKQWSLLTGVVYCC